jgi:hypothetical protein
MTLLCAIALMFALMGNSSHVFQPEEARPKIAGLWRGHSECVVKNSPCHDEINVYRFSKIEGRENAFSVTASKVADGKEVVMGSAECKYDDKRRVLECEKPAIQWTVDGDKMEGALKLEDGTVYRRIYLKKESWGARLQAMC